METTISKKIIKNTAYNAIGRSWNIIIALALTPYIVSKIGVERYGIWALVMVLTGYFGLLDLGVGTSFVKYISEYFAKKDYKKINQVINTGFVFYMFFGVAAVFLFYIFLGPLLTFFKIPSTLNSEAYFVFLVGSIIFSISNMISPFASVQGGLQRMEITNKVSIIMSVPYAAGVIYFLQNGYGLRGLVINNLIIALVTSAINIIAAFRILPQLKFSISFLHVKTLKMLLNYGYKLQIARLANLVSFQTDKLLITYFLNIGLVAFYQLGSTIAQKVRQIELLLISALIPAASEMEATRGKEPLIRFYLRGTKYLAFISVPLLFFLLIDADIIMRGWMGAGYARAGLALRILSVGYFAASITGVASSIAAGVAKTELDMKFGIIMATLNLFLSIVLIIKYGFTGVVIGTSFSLTASALVYLLMFHKYMELAMSAFFKLLAKPLIISAAISIIIILLNNLFFYKVSVAGRAPNLAALIIDFFIFSAAYIFIIFFTKYFDEYDILLFKRRIPGMRYLLRKYNAD